MARFSDVLGSIRRGDSAPAQLVRLLDGHHPGEPSPSALVADQHYFTVALEAMRLDHNRRWFTNCDPLLTSLIEFRRRGAICTVPGVIGPALFAQKGLTQPGIAMFGGARLAGIQPYVGGVLGVTLVLCRVPCQNYVRDLLGVVEKTSTALDFIGTLGPALKVANAVLEGLETLLGIDGSASVLGCHLEFDPDAQRNLRPGWYALLAGTNGAPLRTERLRIRDGQLMEGPDSGSADPLLGRDYVVFSVSLSDARSDAEDLPWLRGSWSRVERWAYSNRQDDWEFAKAHLMALREELRASPDLTRAHADQLFARCRQAARDMHEDALAMAAMGPGGTACKEDADVAGLRDELSAILADG